MTEREQAADHLKVIRSLLERATVYRTISWPTALFGGTLAVILSSVLFFREQADLRDGEIDQLISYRAWVLCWLFALVVTAAFNTLLISRKSAREGRPFFSPGLKMALRAIIPPMLAGGVVGTGLVLSETATASEGASVWVICYGLALLATGGMAPKSIPRLGWLFLLTGLAAFAYSWSDGMNPLPVLGAPDHMESAVSEANLIMGFTFGLLHLGYGLIGWLRGKEADGEESGNAE